MIAVDARLKTAELIVSSPYTRALQTAAIISRETGLKICIEVDLHEWETDKTNQYTTSEESFMLAKADLLFPSYYKFEEVRKSVQEWKRVPINGKWLNEADALTYALVDIILDDLNPRLKRVNVEYAGAVYRLYTKYKKTFLHAFIYRLERKRR